MLVCSRCGFGRTEAAEQADDYWTRGVAGHGETAQRYWTEARASVFSGALSLLEVNGQKGRILDVGGGVGHFARMALDAGWDAYSVDVSSVAAESAAARIGGTRSLSSIPDDMVGTCDAVTMWCVIAHLPDPRLVLADAVKALRPGGQLFLTSPNFRFQIGYAAALARLGKPIDFAGHDHLMHFTSESLGRTLEAVGIRRWRLTFVGVTEDCVADPRLARWAVPAKRVWNRFALGAARAHLPYLGSEFQVVGTAP
jgi:2-polyprenyl-3-methyl-5-hydroxy-6-metoxy-1,4-benzoquinol methylase